MAFQNGSLVGSESIKPQPQNNLPRQDATPSKWLRIAFKTWGILGLLSVSINVIVVTILLLSQAKIITEPTEFFFPYPQILYGVSVVALISTLVYLIPFWGAFKLRKWVLPILIVLSLFALINIVAILFEPLKLSASFVFTNLWNLAIIVLAVLAFIFRIYFTGSYKKLRPQIIFFIVTVPVLTVGTLTLFFPDLPPVNDSDLTQNNFYQPTNEQNSYYTLVEISNQVYEPTGMDNDRYKQFLDGKAWDQAAVDSILSKNEKIISTARNAAALPYYQCTAYAANILPPAEPCPMNYVRSAGRIASLVALSKAQNGDWQSAIDDALVPVRIGQLIEDEPSTTLIDYLVGVSVKNTGLRTLQIILTKYQIPAEVVSPEIAELQKYSQNAAGLKNAFRFDYQSRKNSLAFMNKINSNFYFQPNRFFTEMADDTRQKMAITDVPCYELDATLGKYQQNVEKNVKFFEEIIRWKLPFTRNALLELFKSDTFIVSIALQQKRCESDSLIEQTRLQMALSAYRYNKNQFPASQSELIPLYITRPILNPYTNAAFTFNKDTGIIDQESATTK